MSHIIAMGGGGFSMEPNNPALDRYIVALANKPNPRVCFLGQASGESQDYLNRFCKTFEELACRPGHLSLFHPHTADLESFLLSQDILYVGGGNTKSMLALWREWNLPAILDQAHRQGVILAGLSAGAICWFAQGLTDSIPGELTALPCLGILPGSCTPHYDGEAERRPALHKLIASGVMKPGYAFDDGAGGHFIDGKLSEVVSSRPAARGYYVESRESQAVETALATRYLGEQAR